MFPSLREIPGAEDDNRPEALLAAVCAAPAKVIVSNTVSVVEEKAPFQPPLFAHARHFSLLSAASAGISGYVGKNVVSRYHFRGFPALYAPFQRWVVLRIGCRAYPRFGIVWGGF